VSHRRERIAACRTSATLHDRDVVTARGRICMHRKKIHISTALAGQTLGIKEVDDDIWLVSFMDYDLGHPVRISSGAFLAFSA
jgi:hypothetical protein